MPTIAAKQALLNVWPLLYSAQGRSLTPAEIQEIKRACTLLVEVASRHYDSEAEEFCRALHRSGVLDTGRIVDAQALLAQIDDLRARLE